MGAVKKRISYSQIFQCEISVTSISDPAQLPLRLTSMAHPSQLASLIDPAYGTALFACGALLLLWRGWVSLLLLEKSAEARKQTYQRRGCCTDFVGALFWPNAVTLVEMEEDGQEGAKKVELAAIASEIEAHRETLRRHRATAASADLDAADLAVLLSVEQGKTKLHALEKLLGDCERAVRVRRHFFGRQAARLGGPDAGAALDGVPYAGYDYGAVVGRNCEAVVGYIPIPVGVVGPLVIDGTSTMLPMATTEGCLVASTNRGCKAISSAGGAATVLTRDGMTRAPVLAMPTCGRAAALAAWVEVPANAALIAAAFASTTRFGKVRSVHGRVAAHYVHLRFECATGDAMGMNMVGKGCKAALAVLEEHFPDMQLLALSGNTCTDKKSSAVNWILGRGKSVVAEVILPESIVRTVLKSEIDAMVRLNVAKNLEGSALAGTIGGHNAHAANIVGALFLATGQDIAQVGDSSMCLTHMEVLEGDALDAALGSPGAGATMGRALRASVTMPAIEVGTVGGGTQLAAQAACLQMMGARGASVAPSPPGTNSATLARAVAAAVLAGELSLMAALAAHQLVSAHMKHNRKGPAAPCLN